MGQSARSTRQCLRCPGTPDRRSHLCAPCRQAIAARGLRWCNRCRNEFCPDPSYRHVWCPDCVRATQRKHPARIPGYVPLAVALERAAISHTAFLRRVALGWPVKMRRLGWAWWVIDLPRYPEWRDRREGIRKNPLLDRCRHCGEPVTNRSTKRIGCKACNRLRRGWNRKVAR